MLSATLLVSAVGTVQPVQADAAEIQYPVKLSTVLGQWSSRIEKEKAKYKRGNRKVYWTGGNAESCSYQSCDHDNEVHYCCTVPIHSVIDDKHVTQKTSYDVKQNTSQDPVSSSWQCAGFARKLATDVFETMDFVRYYIIDGKITYTASGTRDYEPQIGDQVRLFSYDHVHQGHSIFITGVDGNNITFADCNGDLNSCEILWDKTQCVSDYTTRKMVKVDKAYLRKNAVFVERPYIAGDLNLNGKIDLQDVAAFKSTMVDKGKIVSGSEYAEYDINGSLYINEYDYTEIQKLANQSVADGYICGSGKSLSPEDCYRNEVKDTWFLYNNGLYQQIDFNKVTFVGPFSREVGSFNVPSTVKHPTSGKSFTVTEIGERDLISLSKPKIYTLSSITIPQTVKTINSYAFHSPYGHNIQNVYFSGTPQLETIADYAFNNCQKLTSLNLRQLGNLKKIGDHAFPKEMKTLTLPYVSSGSKQSTPTLGKNDGIFESYRKDTPTTLVLMNQTSGVRDVVLQDNDIALLNSNLLKLQVVGKTRIYNKNGVLLKSYN